MVQDMSRRAEAPLTTAAGGLKRRLLLQGAGAAAAAVFAAGHKAALADDADFIIHGEGGSWGEAQQNAFVKPFATTVPARKFTYASEAASGVVLSKILLGCGNPDFEAADINTNLGPIVQARGCVANLDPDLVPNLRYIPDVATLKSADSGTYFASTNLAIMGLVWNTKQAKKPSSWNDLWKPEYKGRIGVPDFGYLGQTWLPAIAKLNGGSEADLSKGIEAIDELVKKNQAVLISNTDQAIKLFQSEEIIMAPFWNGRTFIMQKRGIPVSIEFVPNSVFDGDGYVIMKGSSGADVAQRFVNYTLLGENAMRLVQLTGYPPSDTRLKLPPELESIRVTGPQFANVVPIDWNTLGADRDKNLRLWNERIKS